MGWGWGALLPREVLTGGEVAKRGACPRSPGQQAQLEQLEQLVSRR